METTTTSDRPGLRLQIVEAATRLVRDGGAKALTTRGVAEASDVQAPTIYRLFGDKDGLIDAVAEHVMTVHVAAKLATERSHDPVGDLRDAWRVHLEFGLANSELFALLNAPGRARRSPATEAGIEVLRSRVRALAEAGVLRVDEQLALDLIHAAGTGAVLVVLQTPPEVRDLRVADAMLDAVLWRIVDDAARPSVPTNAATAAIAFAPQVARLPGLSEVERALLGEWLSRSIAAAQPR